jgi:hypothetical protein
MAVTFSFLLRTIELPFDRRRWDQLSYDPPRVSAHLAVEFHDEADGRTRVKIRQ